MNKMYFLLSHFLLILASLVLVNCGGGQVVKPSTKPASPTAKSKSTPSKPTASTSNSVPVAAPSPSTPVPKAEQKVEIDEPGGYYMDDGPDAHPPANIDDIPDASPKNEPLLPRSNKPYKALGETYQPLNSSQDYKERGVASWYGKRFHGKKTSSGEIYNMYGMSAAHTILPLPSYVRVTNVANGRSVIVRVNDRGPFKHSRIIDLSYAAAYKLRLIAKGSGMVEVEAIHPGQNANEAQTKIVETPKAVASINDPVINIPAEKTPTPAPIESNPDIVDSQQNQSAIIAPTERKMDNAAVTGYFIQAGAFKNEVNAETLMKKIQGLEIEQNAGINRVYNNGLHRLKLGPYGTKAEAEKVAANIRQQLNISTLITNQ